MLHDLPTHRCLRSAAILLALLTGGVSTAAACSVPVFRYALEHWQPDPYVAIVFHRGELSEEQRDLVEQLDPKADAGYSISNIIVRTVDLDDQPSEMILNLWKQHDTPTLPLLSLQTPPKRGKPQTAWSGELTADNVARLLDSPVRRQLRQRLLGGESIVWLFLESGRREEDDAAFTLLNEELARLQEEIEPPAIEQQDLSALSVDPDALKIAFSSLRLSRDADAEQPLIEMLLRVEPDLRDEAYVHQAMAFPVFARGRVLYALVGEGITPETIEDACRFLSGACQCTVKAQNPGVDVLMAVDWEEFVQPALPYDDAPPTLAGLTSFARSAAAATTDGLPQTRDEAVTTTSPDETSDAAGDRPFDADPATADDPVAANADAPLLDPDSGWESLAPQAGSVSLETETTADDAAGVEALTQNITLMLGLIVAAVVLVSVIVLTRKR